MDSKKICCAAKNMAASVLTKTNIAVASGLAAVSGFAQEGSTVSVELPESEGYSFIPNFSPEQIYKYFDFELVTYSPNTETHPVQ